jgi:RHS repeat-associated protein
MHSVSLKFLVGVLSFSDYYPFGMQMVGRYGNTGDYRYGFQGQETDDEVTGSESHVSYKYRMHDARLGRFLSVDPLARTYPHNSPHAFSENRVIDAFELEGLEMRRTRTRDGNGHITITHSIAIKAKVLNSTGIGDVSEQKSQVADAWKKTFTKTTTRRNKTIKYEVSDVAFEDVESVDPDEDFYVEFIETEIAEPLNDSPVGVVAGQTILGETELNRIEVLLRTKIGDTEWEKMRQDDIKRTAAHELGHVGGLDHPKGQEDTKSTDENSRSLMIQSYYSVWPDRLDSNSELTSKERRKWKRHIKKTKREKKSPVQL